MCIIRFHARVGYLQTYETLLKEINAHPGSAYVPGANDQYQVECLALADRNMNIPCESGIRYPSLTAMLNRRDMMWRITVRIQFNLAYTYHVQCMSYVCKFKIIHNNVCTKYIHCIYSEFFVGCRQTHETRQAVHALTSIFSSLVELNLYKILPPQSPSPRGFQVHNGWSTHTEQHIQLCGGCRLNWQSG